MIATRKHDDFTTPKPGEPGHTYYHYCPGYAKWCRIHRYPDWMSDQLHHLHYPAQFPVFDCTYIKSDGTEANRWREVTVYCGPGAFYPPRGKRGK